MAKRKVYFDHLTSTPVLPEVFAAMRPFFTEYCGAPSAIHQEGLRARDALDQARGQVGAMIGAESPDEIIFTSGGTEAVNLAIKGVAWAEQERGRHLIVTATDHPAILNSAAFLERQGLTVTRIGVDAQGLIDPAAVAAAILPETILICLHQANHDIGTIQPVSQICSNAAERGVPVLVDATASAGALPIDVRSWGMCLVALAPHRFSGPKGVGVLYRHRRVRLESLLHGGVQEGGRRAGTENLPGIVGAGCAAELAIRDLQGRQDRITKLQRDLWDGLKARIPYLRLNGPEPGPLRLSTNLNISFEFVEGEGVALMADMQGLSVASGAACVSKALDVSPVLTAIGLEHALAQANILISLGGDNTKEDVAYALEVLPTVVARLRGMSPLWDEFQRGEIDSVLQPRGRG